jgi:histone acetyltransferase 1
MLGREGVAELTVEDPAEAFEDLRDRNDLRFLVEQGVPEDPKFLEGVGDNSRAERAKWEAGLRKKYKIAQVSEAQLAVRKLLVLRDKKLTCAAPVRPIA